MIHIVFNEADCSILEQVIVLEESLQGDIVQIKDDYAVGPLMQLNEIEGKEYRKNWWKEVLEGGDYEGKVEANEVEDAAVVHGIIEKLQSNETETVWIWCAQNGHDVSGYYWLMQQLKEWQGRVYILYLNNLPFINEKGQLFYPEWISQIQPKEFLKARKLARLITLSEFELDPDEWSKIMASDSYIRILEGGKKLRLEEVDFYDAELKSNISNEFQKAGKIIHQFLSKSKYKTGDAFLLWRLKQIVAAGGIEVQGNIGKMKDFEVKKTSNVIIEG